MIIQYDHFNGITFKILNILPTDTNLDVIYRVSAVCEGRFPIINDGELPCYSKTKEFNNRIYTSPLFLLTDLNGMCFVEGQQYTVKGQYNKDINEPDISISVLNYIELHRLLQRMFEYEKLDKLVTTLIDNNLNDFVSLMTMTSYKMYDKFVRNTHIFNDYKYNDVSYGLKIGHCIGINLAINSQIINILQGRIYVNWLYKNRNKNALFAINLSPKNEECPSENKHVCSYCSNEQTVFDIYNRPFCYSCLCDKYSPGSTCVVCMDTDLGSNEIAYCDKNHKEHVMCKECFKNFGKNTCFSPNCKGQLYCDFPETINYLNILQSPFKKTCPMCNESELFLHGNCDEISKTITEENININSEVNNIIDRIIIKKDFSGKWVVHENTLKKSRILPGDWVLSINNEDISELSHIEFVKKYKTLNASPCTLVCIRNKSSKLYNLIARKRETKIIHHKGIPVSDETYYYGDRPDNMSHIYCRKCEKKWCTTCNKQEHPGFGCLSVRNIRDIPKAVEEVITESMITKCPTCKTPYIKDDGCNLIHCEKCKTTPFCHLCYELIPKKQSKNGNMCQYYHFVGSGSSDPTAKCPLYDGTPINNYSEIYEFINENNHDKLIQQNILREFKQKYPLIKLKRSSIVSLNHGYINKIINIFVTYY